MFCSQQLHWAGTANNFRLVWSESFDTKTMKEMFE